MTALRPLKKISDLLFYLICCASSSWCIPLSQLDCRNNCIVIKKRLITTLYKYVGVISYDIQISKSNWDFCCSKSKCIKCIQIKSPLCYLIDCRFKSWNVTQSSMYSMYEATFSAIYQLFLLAFSPIFYHKNKKKFNFIK